MTNVQAVMSTEVAIVRTTEMVGTVRRMMIDDGIHSVPILDDAEKLQGIITSSDLVEEWDADMGVTMVMTEAVETVSPLATVVEAARLMLDRHIHHLVVMDSGTVVGVVSTFDLLREMAGMVHSLTEAPQGTSGLHAAPGDTVVVRPTQFGGHERRGTVVEVLGTNGAPPYRVRWRDDPHDEAHVVLFFPGTDTFVEPAS